MKNKSKILLLVVAMLATTGVINAQAYRAAATDALTNNGREWVERKLPPSVLTFSDYTGQVEIKAAVSSLFAQSLDSTVVQSPTDTMADFTMTLDKDQVQHIADGKTFSTSGLLVINNTSKKTTAQCVLEPRNNPADGFIISVMIRFNPADFGLKVTGEADENSPLLVRVTGGYLNRHQSNF